MAAPGGEYFIQNQLHTPHPHHASFKALWETKWKQPCEMGIYPFMYGSVKDFQPVADELSKQDMKPPYDWDAYALAFFPTAEKLVTDAQAAAAESNEEKASELYLHCMRASALYRIARFPIPRSAKQHEAWERGKDACRKGLALHSAPTHEVSIPHTHAHPTDGQTLPGFYYVPSRATNSSKVPLIVLVTGLDGYRTELCVWISGWAALDVAVLVVEIPGTGDNPADPADSKSPDRVWDSMFDWVGQQRAIDQTRIAVWGFSTGGYYTTRLAHTHRDKLVGVVAQGGGCHHMFDAEWLEASNDKEYPFDLGKTLAFKYGYDDWDKFRQEARDRYSLVSDGTLDKPHARLLMVNGDQDSIFPIDDLYVACEHGGPKEVRIVKGRPHMGEPDAFGIILAWLFERLKVQGNVGEFMKMIPTKTKY